MRSLAWVVAAIALLLALPARAGTAYLALDAAHIDAGQSVGLRVVVEGDQARGLPQLPAPNGLAIEYNGSRTEMRQVNFKFSTIQAYQYQVLASGPGTYTIGPATVNLAGSGVVATNQVQLEVRARQATAGRPRAPEVTASVDPNPAWVGQVVLYRYGIRSPSEILQVRLEGIAFDGLRQLTYADGKERSYVVQDPTGPISAVDGAVPLLAVARGRRTQPSGVARVARPSESGLGFGFRQDKVDAVIVPSVDVEIRELPPAPPGFSGLIGDFQIRSTIDPRGVVVGGSIPWRIDLVGDGDVAGFSLPRPADTDAVRYYDADAQYRGSVDDDGHWQATATFDRSIVPVRSGKLEIPPLDLVVFSPSQGAYTHLVASVEPFEVRPGKDAENAAGLESYGGTRSDAPIAADAPAVRPIQRFGRDSAPTLGLLIPAGVGAAAAPGALLGVWSTLQLGLAAFERRRAARRRPPTARDALASLPSDPAARLASLDAALRLALAEIGGVQVASLDRAAAAAALPPALAARVEDLTRRLDRARFAGSGEGPDLSAEVAAVVEALAASRAAA